MQLTPWIKKKRKMWAELCMSKGGFESSEWCIVGDFNAVLEAKERKGRSTYINQAEMLEFKQFVDYMVVVDVLVLGKKISWYSSDGMSMSRLDCFLLSEGLIHEWKMEAQWIGNRNISDHCPVWLKGGERNWGPKPFRLNNVWLGHNGFCDFVKDCWESFHVEGWKGFALKDKMKVLKEKLRWWNKEAFGEVDLKIDETVLGLNSLDELVANGGDPDMEQRKLLSSQFWDLIHKKESILPQKSRTKWIQEGDANTPFFHASVKGHRRKNQLAALKVGEDWIDMVDGIKNEVCRFFRDHFSSKSSIRHPNLDDVPFKEITAEENISLTATVTLEELKEVVWSCDGNKSPSPNGFNFNFIKANREILKNEILDFVMELSPMLSSLRLLLLHSWLSFRKLKTHSL